MTVFHSMTVKPPEYFVGRKTELLELKEALFPSNSQPGISQRSSVNIVCVKGKAGVGKTGMISRFLKNIEQKNNTEALCVSTEAGDSRIAYMLWARVLVELAGGETGLSSLQKSLENSLNRQINSDLMVDATNLLPILSAGNLQHSKDMEELRSRVSGFIAELLKAAFNRGREILFLDNLHRADTGSIEMLKEVVAGLEETPLGIILSYRPKKPNGTPVEILLPDSTAAVKEVLLEPFTAEQSFELLNLLITESVPENNTFKKLADSAGGYPFYLELIACSYNSKNSSGWELNTAQLLIENNFSRISPGRRMLVEALAVLGGKAPVQLVLDTVSTVPAPGKSVLLQDDDFAAREKTAFSDSLAFRHDILREVIYSSMDSDKRKNYHTRAAVLLEGIHQNDPRFSGVISRHWKNSGNPGNALTHAVTHLKHVNSIYNSVAVVEWAEEIENLVAEIGVNSENADSLAFALAAEEETLGRMGRIPEREKTLDKLEEFAARYDLIERLTSAYCSRGMIRKDQGRYDEAVELVQKSAAMAESHSNSYRAATALSTLASIISDLRDRLEEAEKLYLKAQELMEKLDKPRDLGINFIHLGILYTDMGRYKTALKYCDRAGGIFRKINFIYGEAVVLMNTANVYVKLDRNGEALEAMNSSIDLFNKAGDTHSMAITLGNRANLFLSLGELVYATLEYEKAIELHRKSDNCQWLGGVSPTRGKGVGTTFPLPDILFPGLSGEG